MAAPPSTDSDGGGAADAQQHFCIFLFFTESPDFINFCFRKYIYVTMLFFKFLVSVHTILLSKVYDVSIKVGKSLSKLNFTGRVPPGYTPNNNGPLTLKLPTTPQNHKRNPNQ